MGQLVWSEAIVLCYFINHQKMSLACLAVQDVASPICEVLPKLHHHTQTIFCALQLSRPLGLICDATRAKCNKQLAHSLPKFFFCKNLLDCQNGTFWAYYVAFEHSLHPNLTFSKFTLPLPPPMVNSKNFITNIFTVSSDVAYHSQQWLIYMF